MAQDFKNLNDLGGLMSDAPEDKIPDRNGSDVQNIDMSLRGLIQTKKGYDLYGNNTTGTGSCTRSYLYKKNFGEVSRVKLRVVDNGTNSELQWLNPNSADNEDGKWERLVGSLTTGAIMGFSPFNNTNVNQLIFCNAVNNYSSWNGSIGYVASVTANTIVHGGANTLAFEGFSASGSIIVDGTVYTYSGISGKTFTGVTPNPTTQNPAVGSGITQVPTAYASLDKGNIFVTSSARIWMSGVPNRESTIYYSKTGDATDYTVGLLPDQAGIEDFPDGGGPITLLDAKDNKKVIIHKEDALSVFELNLTSDGTAKLPSLQTLALSDDVGASNQKAGAGLNQISYFATRVEGLKSLARAIDGSDLNMSSVSDVIRPSLEGYDLSEAAAVYFPKKKAIYVACKSSSAKTGNDKIISYYVKRNTDGNIIGDFSIDDGFVADWIVDRDNLYFVSSVDQNTYKAFDRKSAYGTSIKHRWVSKSFTYGEPALGKEFNTAYVEGFIGDKTKIKISILYGSLGSETTKSKTISWNDSFVSSSKIAALGSETLGTSALGAITDIQDSYPFSVPIHFDVNKATRYKIMVETVYDDDTSEEAYWAISNIATNPDLKTKNNNKTINSN